MNKQQEQLSIIIPAYKGLKYLIKNEIFWKEITNYIGAENIYLIEDSLEEEMKEFANNLKWNYFSKENGNWGSVINFAVKNIEYKTDYVFILDIDDVMEIPELEKVVDRLKTPDIDILWTKFILQRFHETTPLKVVERFWIHTTYISTQLFKKMPTMHTNIYFTDNQLMAFIEHKSNKTEFFDVTPYVYFIDVPGQSVDTKSKVNVTQLESLFQVINKWGDPKNSLYIDNKIHNNEYLNNWSFWKLRHTYDTLISRNERKIVTQYYKKMKKIAKPTCVQRLVWSKLYILFTFKWLQWGK